MHIHARHPLQNLESWKSWERARQVPRAKLFIDIHRLRFGPRADSTKVAGAAPIQTLQSEALHSIWISRYQFSKNVFVGRRRCFPAGGVRPPNRPIRNRYISRKTHPQALALRNGKAETLRFPECYFLLKFDVRKASKQRFRKVPLNQRLRRKLSDLGDKLSAFGGN